MKGSREIREPRIPGELTIARVEAFSDGVFAFAATLLVLNLTVPQVADAVRGVNLRFALAAEWPAFAIYLISFLMIAQVWIGHHFLFSHYRRADHSLVWLNNFLLSTVAIIPFSTALLARYATHEHDRVLAALVYGTIWTVGATCMSATFWYASGKNRLLQNGVAKMISSYRLATAVGPLVYLTFTLLALVNFWLSVAGFAFVPLFYILQGLRYPGTLHADDSLN